MIYPEEFDVIVVGGGHAGVEAAAAAARMGVKTLLLSHNLETIGLMSCNPAIGGIGKGHLVREIDALDGLMGRAADLAGIQWRTLNSRKGPAVRATRAQADRQLYRLAIRQLVENQANLQIFQTAVSDLIIEGAQVRGVRTQHQIDFHGQTVILTAGTFLAGKIHVGLHSFAGGRAGDPASELLAARLREMALGVGRLKTGTPPRLDARTVDFSQLAEQPGDGDALYFSQEKLPHPRQVSCFIAHTNGQTHHIIRGALDQSPMYSGLIEGVGPRYCPSIEDKVMRFADRDSHQVFIEPESLQTNELYPNGLSTSLPFATQLAYIHSIKGLERAQITRPGYAIEYDYFDPQGLRHSLETKAIKNLFFAGQINGTTGYEEAAAQGVLAGINGALRCRGQEPWYPRRDQAYLGVLVDDLISLGTSEPYRMFTSRAEYRLLLREDNADQRLTALGHGLGVVSPARFQRFSEKMEALEREQQRLQTVLIRGERFNSSHNLPALELLKRPEVDYGTLAQFSEFAAPGLAPDIIEQIDINAKYAGYLKRQREEVAQLQANVARRLPQNFDYGQVRGLSAELTEKLNRVQPENIDQASRIQGVTPACLSLLLVYLKKHRPGRRPNNDIEEENL